MTTIALGFTRVRRQGQEARLARVLRHGRALAVPPRRDPDPDAALAHERELRGALRRRLPRQPVPRRARVRRGGAGAQSAHALGARGQAAPGRRPRHRATRCTSSTATSATPGTSRRTPPRSATAATSARTGWPTRSSATTRRATRSSTATTRPTETTYVSRNRQLSTFNDIGARRQGRLHAAPGAGPATTSSSTARYEYTRFKFKDFTDIRTGSLYGYSASVIQLYLSATY